MAYAYLSMFHFHGGNRRWSWKKKGQLHRFIGMLLLIHVLQKVLVWLICVSEVLIVHRELYLFCIEVYFIILIQLWTQFDIKHFQPNQAWIHILLRSIDNGWVHRYAFLIHPLAGIRYFKLSIGINFILKERYCIRQTSHKVIHQVLQVACMPDEHYSDVMMNAMASQLTGISIVCATVCSGTDQRKHQSSASLAFLRGIHQWPVDSPHKGPVRRKMFSFDDVIMTNLVCCGDSCQNRNGIQAILRIAGWGGVVGWVGGGWGRGWGLGLGLL